MKKVLKNQTILSILMIFAFIILLSGCYTRKIISASVLSKHLKTFCEVHTADTTYWLYNARIEGDTLIGIIGNYNDIRNTSFTKVYIKSDSSMSINSDKTLIFIPLEGIVNAEIKKISNEAAMVFGIGLGVAIVWLIVAAMWAGV